MRGINKCCVVISDEWSSVKFTGQAPPPGDDFTLTTSGGKRAAMFGGWTGIRSDDLYIAELRKNSVVSV